MILDKTDFYRNLDEVLGLDAGTLRGDTSLASLDLWDSLAVMGFIAMADEKYGVLIPAKRIAGCETADDLAAALAEARNASAVA